MDPIGINALRATEPFWYPIADLVASKLLTGEAPRVQRALRCVGKGKARGLRSVEQARSARRWCCGQR